MPHSNKLVPAIALGGLILGGCANYNIAGQFEDTGQVFIGNVIVSFDQGSINVATEDGSVTCSGSSRITSRPSLHTDIGGQGTANAKCSDGRTFKVDFIQTTSGGGHGQGIDNLGNVVTLFFDKSVDTARSRLKQKQLDALVQ